MDMMSQGLEALSVKRNTPTDNTPPPTQLKELTMTTSTQRTFKVDHVIGLLAPSAVAAAFAGLGRGLGLRIGLFAGACRLGLGLVLIAALPVLVLLLLLLRLAFGLFAKRLGQHAEVVLGVLLEILCRNAIIRELGIPGELIILVDDLLRRAAHFAFRAGTVEDPVNDVPDGTIAVVLVPRA